MNTIYQYLRCAAVLITGAVLGLLACQNEEDAMQLIQDDALTYTMRMTGGLTDFDSQSTRAAAVWADGTQVIVQFQQGEGYVPGTAIFNQKSGLWTVTTQKTLTDNDASLCQVYFFLEPVQQTSKRIDAGAATIVYADQQGSFQIDPVKKEIIVRACVTPLTSRLRLVGKAETAFGITGLMRYTSYDISTNSFTSSTAKVSGTFNAEGSSAFIYALFADNTARKLTASYTASASFTRSFGADVLKAGTSGYLNYPYKDDSDGWILVNPEGEEIGLPTLSDVELENVTHSSATVKASVMSNGAGEISAAGFVYATTHTPTLDNSSCASESLTDLRATLTELAPETTYYVRAYATNEKGTAYGAELAVKTERTPSAPVVKTGSVTNIQRNQVDVSGTITDLGDKAGLTAHGHVWSTQPNPTVTDYKTDLGSITKTGGFSSTLKNWKPGTTYYVRAYGRNQNGVGYGESVQFTTLPGDVTLTTKAVTSITFNAATGGGSISELQGNKIAERGVCWNTDGSPTRTQNSKASKDETDDFSVQMTGLSENTKYYVRAYVLTEKGTTFYGQEVQFQTPYEVKVPSLSAVTATGVTYKSASFAATVTSDGHGTLKDAGFVYSTSHNPTVNDSKLSCGVKTSLTATVSTLNPETTYYVRAYATNEKGTAYGEEIAITTKKQPEGTDIGKEGYPDDTEWDASAKSGNTTIGRNGYPEDTQWDANK